MKPKLLKAIPKNELLWVTETRSDGEVFYTTSDRIRTKYNLYQKVSEGVKLLTSAPTPVGFSEIIADFNA